MKTYVLMISEVFPATHPKKGQPTNFIEKIGKAVNMVNERGKKRHTIRGNYPLWKKRFEEIEAGRAVLSIRSWTGKPYRSKQQEHFRLDKNDGIGLEMITLRRERYEGEEGKPLTYGYSAKVNGLNEHMAIVAINDGLTIPDFEEWFSPAFDKAEGRYPQFYDISCATEMDFAVIHFTDYRY